MIFNVIFLVLGVLMVYYSKAIGFNKRNIAGVEEHKSYAHFLGSRVFRLVLKVIGWLFILYNGLTLMGFGNLSH